MQPRRASFTQHAIAFAVAAAFQPQLLAQTLPSGGQVAAGQATISQPAPGFMQIDQASHKAILNWESFSIGPGGHVNFWQQQGSSSVALNRVLGNNPSQIFGNLTANGRVFLVNPSGILFGPGASVSVGGLVASTLSITDQNFLDGNYVFSNAGGAGSVVNQGSINSFSGYTALLAPQVTNEGFIFANMGNVALAAGERVSLDMVGDNLIRVSVDQAALDAAIVNRGNIEAFGGNVLLAAHSANALLDTVLNTQGFVRAARMIEQGGEIVLDGGSRGTAALGGFVGADDHLAITGADVRVTGFVSSGGGQTIEARALAVQALGGNGASLFNAGGDQRITLTGDGANGGLDVVGDGSSFASISHFDPAFSQFITVVDGDHINVDGGSGPSGPFFPGAGIFAGGSAQHISITGSGRNAITLGSAGATGQSVIAAREQTIVAGTGTQSGSITLTGGSATNAFVGIVTDSGTGPQTQSISTTGALRIAGAQAPAQNTGTGIFHNRQGQQTIRAGSIDILAGASGSGNGAFLATNNGADQRIEVAGGHIRVIAGQGGANNTASLNTNGRGHQTIVGNPDIFVAGGATSNASIQAGIGKIQVIEAHHITLTNGVDSPGNSAGVILAPTQRITATGDVTLTAHSGTGTASGVRIGAPTAGTATDLVLNVGGNLLLTGGTTGTNAASLGGGPSSNAFENHIVVTAAGDVVLDGATGGAGARIGTGAPAALPGGDISINARNVRFMGSAPAAIRTSGSVALNAGEISQAPNGLILANALTTRSEGSTLLGGSNHVSSFSGAAGGDLLLRNLSSFLTLGPVDAAGALSIDQAGSLLIQATDAPLVVRGGLVNVTTGGDLRLVGGPTDGAQAVLLSGGDMDLNVGGAVRLDEGAGKFSWARIQTEDNHAVIRLDGDFYVNGVAGDPRDGKSGFFIGNRPAKVGRDLILE